MPIAGLTEQRRLPRGGKIRLGEKKKTQGGKEYPAALDHFLFDPNEENQHLIPLFEELYGKHPTEIEIAFAAEDPEVVFPQYYKRYGASILKCKGDGDRATFISDAGEWIDCDCLGPAECAAAKNAKGQTICKGVGSLQFFLPDLPVMQVFQIDTGSINSIRSLNSALDLLRRVSGRISMIPVKLILKPKQTVRPGTNKANTNYVMDIMIPAGLRQLQALKPLIADNVLCPPACEALPDDLYPASSQLPAPGMALPEPLPVQDAPTAIELAADPAVIAAFAATDIPTDNQARLIAYAIRVGMAVEDLVQDIQQAPQKPAPASPVGLAYDREVVAAFNRARFDSATRAGWVKRAKEIGLSAGELIVKVDEFIGDPPPLSGSYVAPPVPREPAALAEPEPPAETIDAATGEIAPPAESAPQSAQTKPKRTGSLF